MDIEKDCKAVLFKDLSNISSPTNFLKTKDFEMTPTSMGQSRKEDKISFFESGKREGTRQYYFSWNWLLLYYLFNFFTPYQGRLGCYAGHVYTSFNTIIWLVEFLITMFIGS